MEPIFDLTAPTGPELPLLVSVPHTGTHIPPALAGRMTPAALATPDTDWHLHRLYDFVPALGGWLLTARHSRFVVDLNRPPDGAALYPGRSETSLVPVNTFASEPLYRSGEEPGEDEIAARRTTFWDPYHAQIRRCLDALRAKHGYALLWDAHSITSVVPRFWPEPLPGLMLGDADGTSAAGAMSSSVLAAWEHGTLTFRHNSPFKGGYITRQYGRPAENIHALQLEMSQRLYMVEGPPFAWDPARAAGLVPTLRSSLQAFLHAAATLYPR